MLLYIVNLRIFYVFQHGGAVAVNPNEIKTLLVNGLTPSLINGILLFNNGPRSLPRNSPD